MAFDWPVVKGENRDRSIFSPIYFQPRFSLTLSAFEIRLLNQRY